MAEAALVSMTSVLIRKLGSPLLNKFRSFFGVKKDVKKLLSNFKAIQSVLKDAEEQQWSNNSIRDWLDKLKDVAYDIEDILDEIETKDLRCRVEIQGLTMNKVLDFFTPSNSVVFNFNMKSKIREVVERLDVIVEEKKNFNLSERPIDRRNEIGTRNQTHSYINESEVHGRKYDRKKLVHKLKDMGGEEEENVSVIPIVGMGGLGKTMLTKLVYNDDRVKSYFDRRMWAFVSQNFDQAEIMRAIIASANVERCDLEHMDPLQSRLRNILEGKKYLLVLDDVWNENLDEWLELKALLNVGARGSKILVTTRSMNVASIMGTGFTHKLKRLQSKYCWSLFKQRAFPQRDDQGYPHLLDIGKDIVNRCEGVPLAIKALGGLLRDKRRESYWQSVKNDEIWKLNDDQILPSLKLSYNHLPSHLKRCFTFCSVFPKGHNFEKAFLIQVWMAEGFIQSSEDGKSMEDIGKEYFDELCCSSFLQEVPNKVTFKLHDLIHDLARSIGRSEALAVEARRIEAVCTRTRHSSIVCTTMTTSIDPMSFHNAKQLRTFLLVGDGGKIVEVSNVISSLTSLRVLDLSHTRIKHLPNSVEKLKHLRYLNLSNTLIRTVPKSICSLQNLQTLKLLKCRCLRKLPNDMWKMVSLRNLEIDCYNRIARMPPKIGELRDLQMLSVFIVGKKSGHGIDELQGLNLGGELEIKDLQNVLNPSESEKVKLRERQNLRSLGLSWAYVNDIKAENHERVIESLQPHSNVQKLSIKNYMGTKFPRWLMLLEFPDLVEVSLVNCRRCEILPPLWQLYNLEVLTIVNMPNLEKLFIEETWQVLPHMKRLNIQVLPEMTLIECNRILLASLKACPGITSLELGGFSEMTFLPDGLLKNKSCLANLCVRNCPKLKSLSKDLLDLAAITKLEFDNCGEIESLAKEIHNLTSLVHFATSHCSQLQLLPDDGFQGLTSLRYVHILSCKNLRSLGEGLQHLNALEYLELRACPELAALPESLDKLTALKFLDVYYLPKLASLPKEIGSLTSLVSLRLYSCPKLLSLPESMRKVTSLRFLCISHCPVLERRCKREKGMDWHKIAHVPQIYIRNQYI